MKRLMKKQLGNERGQGAVEYGGITLIVTMAVVALSLSNPVQVMMDRVFNNVEVRAAQLGQTMPLGGEGEG